MAVVFLKPASVRLAEALKTVNKADVVVGSGNVITTNLVATEVREETTDIVLVVAINVDSINTETVGEIKLYENAQEVFRVQGINVALNVGRNSITLDIKIPYTT